MLSVCIPVFNHNITPLLRVLAHQAQALPYPTEVVVIDDASAQPAPPPAHLAGFTNISYVPLPANIGRAAVRNLFLQHTQYPWLLFLDCDVAIPKTNFLNNYICFIGQRPAGVVCGGRLPGPPPNNPSHRLRWQYARLRENIPTAQRQLNPYAAFMTNNFVVHRQVLAQNPFNPKLTGYGHEDTLFGFDLKQAKVPVWHINNPVVKADTETNRNFLHKTKQAIVNLHRALAITNHHPGFVANVRLLAFYYNLIKKPVALALVALVPTGLLKYWLLSGYAPMRAFDLYKLKLLVKQASSDLL